MLDQNLENLVHIEIVSGQAEVVDAGLRVRRARSQADVLRPRSDLERGGHSRLPILNWHPEKPLIELQGALDIGNGERHVVQRPQRDGGLARLRHPPERGRQRRKRKEKVSARDLSAVKISPESFHGWGHNARDYSMLVTVEASGLVSRSGSRQASYKRNRPRSALRMPKIFSAREEFQ